jgi:hypothetical protein
MLNYQRVPQVKSMSLHWAKIDPRHSTFYSQNSKKLKITSALLVEKKLKKFLVVDIDGVPIFSVGNKKQL